MSQGPKADFATMSEQRPGQKTSIRFSDADYDLFKDAAETEGADNIIQWLITIGRKRARLLAVEGPVRVTEVLVPPPEHTRLDSK
ncbi:hypothetical protein [Planctomyces sp. SH-PL14]|uniref:hypothetical protein n=1 Tax=Planctomyces sp. SH-PL14 TaxID=1632864 RepID=UPI00078D8645|nr:hypothetical protein [Planctomyces sp. SH-PL14]AMV16612.1 hypothetical protein VT03_01900 [Planctomyces sp. SH-PL14]